MPSFKAFFAQLPVDTPALRLRGIGVQEWMRPEPVDRPTGTPDYLCMLFHEPARIGRSPDDAPWWPAQTIMVWTPGAGQYYGRPDARWSHSWVHCDGSFVKRRLKTAGLPLNQPLPVRDPAVMERQLLAMYDEIMTHAQPNEQIIRSQLDILWLELARATQPPSPSDAVPGEFLDLKRWLETAFEQPVTLKELAGRVHLSVPHFCARFKQYFNASPIDYVLHLRLHRSAFLLRDQSLSVTQIADQVGYADIYSFSKRFKAHFGMSPTAMRQRLIGGDDAGP